MGKGTSLDKCARARREEGEGSGILYSDSYHCRFKPTSDSGRLNIIAGLNHELSLACHRQFEPPAGNDSISITASS